MCCQLVLKSSSKKFILTALIKRSETRLMPIVDATTLKLHKSSLCLFDCECAYMRPTKAFLHKWTTELVSPAGLLCYVFKHIFFFNLSLLFFLIAATSYHFSSCA
uniref:Uncharacterized protein n=1 Tax=Trypanosoma congolense (strain IL3000) TaxID=1068625 RepID=G0UMX2_TRYCI|nr:hypothetical protein, unlikely [Trypanosoma congolense IL3000]